jgi:hypothetical protein
MHLVVLPTHFDKLPAQDVFVSLAIFLEYAEVVCSECD